MIPPGSAVAGAAKRIQFSSLQAQKGETTMADVEKGIKLLGELMGEETARGAYGYFKNFDEGFANVLFMSLMAATSFSFSNN